MTTIRVAVRHRYAAVDRRTVNDSALSFRARGLLVWLLDKPDDWETSVERLASQTTEGEFAITSACRELERAGYLARTKTRGEDGRWHGEWLIQERPPAETAPGVSADHPRKPRTVPPAETAEPIEPELTETENPLAPTAQRARDPLWDAVTEACGIDPSGITKAMRGELAAAVKALREVNVDPAEVPARARAYRKMMTNAILSPSALAKWWPTLNPKAPTVLLDAPVREVCGICNRYTLGLIECPTDRDDCPAHLSPTVAESVGNHPASRAN